MESESAEIPVEKQYYAIGEVAKMLGIAVSHVRHWESEFDILKPKKTRKGDRFFTRTDIENLKLIHHLVKEKGYTLDGAKKKLKQNSHEILERYKLVESLKEIRIFLHSLKNFLDNAKPDH